MAFTRRNLNPLRTSIHALLLALGLLLAEGSLQAQPVSSGVAFRTLALGKTLSDVFYDYKGKPVSVMAGSSGFSAPYRAEPGSLIEFYREIPPEKPGEAPVHLKLADFRLGDVGPFLVLIEVNPEDINDVQVHVVDDTWEKHPVSTIQIFNYSERMAMVKVGDEVAQMKTGQSHLFPYSGEMQVWIQAAVREEENWVLRVSGPQAILPNSRSTIVLLDQPPSEDRPITFEVLVRNFLEFAPKPPES